MDVRIAICVILISSSVTKTLSKTHNHDVRALCSIKNGLKNVPSSWNTGSDPCANEWEGIGCRDSRVVSILLSGMGLRGRLSNDIKLLTNLEILDLSYNKGLTGFLPPGIGSLVSLTTLILSGCNFIGQLPYTLGSLSNLRFLSLYSNGFSGAIPKSLGKLSKLEFLDLSDNMLTGDIPVSNGTNPGLDMLVHLKFLGLGRNQLSGEIPHQLFNEDMKLNIVLLDYNQLSGPIPLTITLVPTLETIRLDGNSLTGSVPSNINTLTRVKALLLSNNKLGGSIPDFTGINLLSYLDVSNNSFEVSNVPTWITSLPALTTLIMDQCQIQGELPTGFFNSPRLQKVSMKDNKITGMLDLGAARSTNLQNVDFQNNMISTYFPRPSDDRLQLLFAGNPVCGTTTTPTDQNPSCSITHPPQPIPSYTTPRNCEGVPCSTTSDKSYSPTCYCSHPYTGTLTFAAPRFSSLTNFKTYGLALEQALLNSANSNEVPVGSVSLSNVSRDTENYLHISVEIFPLGDQDRFSRSDISRMGYLLSSQIFAPPSYYGPFTFRPDAYIHFISDGSGSDSDSDSGSKSTSRPMSLGKRVGIIGGSMGGLVILMAAAAYFFPDNFSLTIFNNCCNNLFNITKKYYNYHKDPEAAAQVPIPDSSGGSAPAADASGLVRRQQAPASNTNASASSSVQLAQQAAQPVADSDGSASNSELGEETWRNLEE